VDLGFRGGCLGICNVGKESRVTRLISWLLNVAYLACLVLLMPVIVWQSVRTGKYRAGYREKFLGLVPRRESNATCVWIHAVSVGEVNLLATILAHLRHRHPDWQFVVSTTSFAGHQLARKKYADLTVLYCPLDFSWAVRTAMRRIRPALLVLAELELWPNLIAAAKDTGAGVAIINGRLSDRSFPRYRRIRPLAGHVLRQIDLIAAQNVESAERFRNLGAPPDRVHVTGSLKYDGAQMDRNNSRTITLRQLAGFADDEIVFLAGSTQEPEEQIAIDIFRRLSAYHPGLRLVLVPRHPERFDAVSQLLEASGLSWLRRSQLNDSAPCTCCDPTDRRTAPILLVDTIGELSAWWGTAKIAFVGGSFGSRGGQNMIEPAAYGAAVSFGPNTWNFRDIVANLLSAEAAVLVRNDTELEAFVHRSLNEPQFAAALGQRAQALVRSQLGATERTVQLIDALISQPCKPPMARRSAA
jgi:3-deoxy-D-manno-octulosonic-acid transferase